jgi:glycosyltransferase involved in cell wall biosynthesis
MRILLTADFLPPFLGGAELQTAMLARELAARGHAVASATVWHSGQPPVEADGGVTVHRLRGATTAVPAFFGDPGRRRYHPPFPDPGVVVGLRNLIRAFRPDVVHATGWMAYSALAATPDRIPFLVSARDFGYASPVRTLWHDGAICDAPGLRHDLAPSIAMYGGPRGVVAAVGVAAMRPLLVRRVAAIHTPSSGAADYLRRDLVPDGPDRVVVIPDMTETPRDRSCRADDASVGGILESLPSEPFIAFVGALQRHKGIEPLVAAWAGMSPRPPLVVVGTRWPDTPDRWPDGIVVLTDVPNHLVQEVWRRSLFGVLPSLVPETFGGVITEAMREGRSVVASAIGGPLDIVDPGVTGLLTAPGNVEELRSAMQLLTDDDAMRVRMGVAGRERIERFAPAVVMPAFEALYERAVAGSSSREAA